MQPSDTSSVRNTILINVSHASNHCVGERESTCSENIAVDAPGAITRHQRLVRTLRRIPSLCAILLDLGPAGPRCRKPGSGINVYDQRCKGYLAKYFQGIPSFRLRGRDMFVSSTQVLLSNLNLRIFFGCFVGASKENLPNSRKSLCILSGGKWARHRATARRHRKLRMQ